LLPHTELIMTLIKKMVAAYFAAAAMSGPLGFSGQF
jgi:hypothetical protein